MTRILLTLLFVCAGCSVVWAAPDAVEVSPSAPYDRFTILESLAFFWIGILGTVVIIRMKLKEVERTQRLGLDKEEKDVPLLD